MAFHDPLHDGATKEDLERAVAHLNATTPKRSRFELEWSTEPRRPRLVFRDATGIAPGVVFDYRSKTELYAAMTAFAKGLSWQRIAK